MAGGSRDQQQQRSDAQPVRLHSGQRGIAQRFVVHDVPNPALPHVISLM